MNKKFVRADSDSCSEPLCAFSEKKKTASHQQSVKIKNLSFFMMIAIVWTHSRLPKWDVVPDYFHQLAIFNEIGEDAVAPFFLITGYLFFQNFQMSNYVEKLKKRAHSLVVPYILWNTIGVFLWFFLVACSGYKYTSNQYSFDSPLEVIGNIFVCKYTILWYVGVIIIYAVAAPIFYYLLRSKTTAVLSVIVFLLIGVSFHHPFASPLVWMSIYMMGALLGVYYKDYFYQPQPIWLTVVAVVVFPISVWLCHQQESMLYVNLRQWSSVFFYIGMYDIFDRIFHFKQHRVYNYSFFLYASHYFLVHVSQRYVITHFSNVAGCWIAYLVVPLVVILLCLSFARLLDYKAHSLYKLLSGGR